MNGHLSAILRFLIILMVALPTVLGGLSSCRRYVGDEQAVGKALAVADSLRCDEPSVTYKATFDCTFANERAPSN